MHTPPAERFQNSGLTVAEAAKRLGISRTAAYGLIRSGVLRSFHVGRSRRVSAAAVDDAIARLEETAASRSGKAA